MNFHAAIHPLQMKAKHPDSNSFFAPLENRRELLNALREQIKIVRGDEYVSSERGNDCAAYFNITQDNFLRHLQEYTVALDQSNLDNIFMGIEQTRFNHLVEIHNNVGIYLPVFFFFPLRISIKQNALPIFVGSSVKLQVELREINKTLKAHDNIDIGQIGNKFVASEEDMEDYEASHEGTENFWPSFSYIVMEALVKKSLEVKLPIFIF